jgi:predicted choloylglycine hydrolase
MFQVEVDKAKNLLKIIYAQHVEPEDTKRVEEKIPTLLPDLRPGFRMLTDLSNLESMDLACVPYIKRMMDLCNKKGVEMVVRVIPDPQKDIGLNILSLFHYRRRVRLVTCETLEEALKALAE